LNGSELKTTELYITFKVSEVENILPVFPDTYETAMLYLEGKRQIENNL
jgi:hypothetical protein